MRALAKTPFFLILVLLLVPFAARAQTALPPGVMDEGGLYFPGAEPGTVEPAPLLKTDIVADVSGPIARYTLRHTFINPGKTWTEAIYTYPLPADSAVDHLVMTVGDRVVKGEIAEKKEAERRYAAARTEGKSAGLVSQQRPNVFSTSVANIAPGAHVIIEIGFQEALQRNGEGYRLRMPLVVGPRYYPNSRPSVVAADWTSGRHEQKPLGTNEAPISTLLRPEASGKGNPVTVEIDLDAGFPLGDIESPSHDVKIERLDPRHVRVRLKESEPADKDFSLDWRAKPGTVPVAGLFAEKKGDMRYALMTLMPPDRTATEVPRPPREVVFVVDTSGSMNGTSIDQARAALRLALARLKPDDTFRILRFSSDVSAFRGVPVPATPQNVSAAADYVSNLQAEGGTEIVGAVDRALSGSRDKDRLTQVVLITDGAVGNENQLFDLIDEKLGGARLFTVGIGSVPNGYLMSRAARSGRGTFTYIQNANEVAARMSDLFLKLERPALTDVTVTWQGGAAPVETWPNPVPDLYLGEPVTVLAALPDGVTGAEVKGRIDGKIWQTSVSLPEGADRPGIAALWGREKIAGLMDDLRRGEGDRDTVRGDIVRTALKFDLVSSFTSLIAVDDTPVRPADAELTSGEVPLNLPDGWSREHITGERWTPPSDAAVRTFDRTDAALGQRVAASRQLASLPQTATAGPLLIIAGIIIMVLGAAMASRRRRVL